MRTSEVRAKFMALSKDHQELATVLVLDEAAVEKAKGDPQKMFAEIAEDPDRLIHLGNLADSYHWRPAPAEETPPAEAAAETSTPTAEPKPGKKAESAGDADFLRQVYGKSVADGSMSIP